MSRPSSYRQHAREKMRRVDAATTDRDRTEREDIAPLVEALDLEWEGDDDD